MSLSKKTRFEVFKRDSFTCQYCGQKAPEVILEVDHIMPKSKGGKNDLMNLITSCRDCNRGKSNRTISDTSIVEKQRKQLEESQERIEQLKMLLDWRESLQEERDFEFEEYKKYVSDNLNAELIGNGIVQAKKNIKKFGLLEMLISLDLAVDKYAKFNSEGELLHSSVEMILKKAPSIANIRKISKDKPYMHDLFYCRSIVNNRFRLNSQDLSNLIYKLEQAHIKGKASIEELKSLCVESNSYWEVLNELEDYINA